MATTFAPLIPRDHLTPDALDELESTVRNLRLRGAFFALELARFLPSLEGAGCEPVVLKGVALAQTAYPDPGSRFFSDLDILVRREAIDAACTAMHRFGYTQPVVFRSHAFYERHHFHRILRSPSGVVVEMHWALSRPGDYFRLDADGVRDRSRRWRSGDTEIRVPSDADQLLHGSIQALQEGFSDIRRMIDAALLLRHAAADHPSLVDEAARGGLSTALWLLLQTTREVCGVAAPSQVEAAVRPGALVRRCLESLSLGEKSLGLEARHRSGLKNLLRWLCAPSPRRAARDMGRFVFPPEAMLVDEEDAEEPLGGAHRSVLAVKRSMHLLRILGYQSWRLASRGRSRPA